MKSSSFASYSLVIVVLLLGQQAAWTLQPTPKVDNSNTNSKYPQTYATNYNKLEKNKKTYYAGQDGDYSDSPLSSMSSSSSSSSASLSSSDLDNNRIQISEPYKTLIQTSTRLALTQSGFSKHVDVDMAMDLLSDTSYMLSKPATLKKFLKHTIILVTLMTSVLLLPGAYKFAETIWREPQQVLKMLESNGIHYLPNGINEKTIVNLLGPGGAGEFMSSVGLSDGACREQSICQFGELVKCSFPKTSDILIHFIELHFSRPRYRQNKYVNSFLLGFQEQNCATLINSVDHDKLTPTSNAARSDKNCIGNLFASYLQSRCPRERSREASSSYADTTTTTTTTTNANKHKVEFQTIQVGRA